MDATCFIFNRDPIAKAGGRGFDPRPPLSSFQRVAALEQTKCSPIVS
jgi:hypothetical protein